MSGVVRPQCTQTRVQGRAHGKATTATHPAKRTIHPEPIGGSKLQQPSSGGQQLVFGLDQPGTCGCVCGCVRVCVLLVGPMASQPTPTTHNPHTAILAVATMHVPTQYIRHSYSPSNSTKRESDPHLFLRWATPSVQRLSHRHQAAHETPSTRTPLPPPPPSSLRHPRSLCHWQRRRWVVAASCSGLCALCHPQHRAHRNMDRYLTLSKHHHPLTNAWRSGSEPLQCSTSCVLLVAGYFVKRLQWHWVLLRV